MIPDSLQPTPQRPSSVSKVTALVVTVPSVIQNTAARATGCMAPTQPAAAASALACWSALRNSSAGWAPEIPYRRSMTKNGTPLMPSAWASSMSAWTSAA